MYDFHVVLGCFGLKSDDFVNCAGIENVILKVGPATCRYSEILAYFETCRLYDKPLLELSAIRHFVFNLQDRFDQIDRPLWMPKKFQLYEKFVLDHRHCGLIVKLAIPEENISEGKSSNIERPGAVVSHSSELPGSRLRLVRGRR